MRPVVECSERVYTEIEVSYCRVSTDIDAKRLAYQVLFNLCVLSGASYFDA